MCFKIIILWQNLCTNQFLLQNIHKIQQILRLVISDIIHCIRRDWQTILSIAKIVSMMILFLTFPI